MDAEELKGLAPQELEERIQRAREEIFNLRFKAVTEPVTDAAGLRRRRREVAVMRTVIRQKELAAPGAPARPASGSREERQRKRDRAAAWSANRAEQARKKGPAKAKSTREKAAARAAKKPGRKPVKVAAKGKKK